VKMTRQQRRRLRREAKAPVPWGYLAVLAAGLFPALMVLWRVPGFNGPSYWMWRYSEESVVPYALIAAVAGVLIWWSERWEPRRAVWILTGTHGLLLFSYIALSERSLAMIEWRVRHPDITSYYTEAEAIRGLPHWIAGYDRLLPRLRGHAQTHPPGPILYFHGWLQALGPRHAALWGGITLGLLALLGVPLLHRLVERLTGDAEAGRAAATLWAILPGPIVMLPSFDQAYPVLTMGIVLLWTVAIVEQRHLWAAGFGAVLAVAWFFTHSFLVLGVFCVLSAALLVWLRREAWKSVVAAGAIGVAVTAGIFTAVFLASRYHHLNALWQSMKIQEGLAQVWGRPYRLTVFWDLYDFFLAGGWTPAGLLVAGFLRLRAAGHELPLAWRVFAPAALGTILVVDLSGLLRAETARVWLFLQPLAIACAAVELAAWSPLWRQAAYATGLLALAIIRGRLNFL
jgi:hypothetical protein